MGSNEYRPELGTHQVELDPTLDPLSRFGTRVRALVWPTRTLVGVGSPGTELEFAL